MNQFIKNSRYLATTATFVLGLSACGSNKIGPILDQTKDNTSSSLSIQIDPQLQMVQTGGSASFQVLIENNGTPTMTDISVKSNTSSICSKAV